MAPTSMLRINSLRGRRQRLVEPVAEQHDHRHEHQVGQHAAGHHDRGDPRADDVAHAQQLGRQLAAQNSAASPLQPP